MTAPSTTSVILMAGGAIFAGCGVVMRLRRGAPLTESAGEVAARGASWPHSRIAAAGIALGLPLLVLGAIEALALSAPAALAALGIVYGLMIIVGITAGRRHENREPRSVWDRFVDICATLAAVSW